MSTNTESLQQKKRVYCPNCGEKVVWDITSEFRPFCSERCKLIDAGNWASEQYQITTDNKDLQQD